MAVEAEMPKRRWRKSIIAQRSLCQNSGFDGNKIPKKLLKKVVKNS